MIKKINNYKHIIWDWNGTLVDDVWLVVEIMNKMLKKRHLPGIDSKKYREIFDFPVIKYYIKLGFDFSRESFEKLTVEFISEYYERFNECRLFNHTEEFLKKIRDLGISQSILSASKEDVLIEKIKYYGIEKNFCKIVGLENHYAESKIEKGKKWIVSLNLNPHEVLLIGDTVHDFIVSKHIGSDCQLIANGHNSRKKLEKLGACVVGSMQEMLG
ncbi:MAG: HAD family hydrolase [Candidatus Atribacteria bacterium]|nr:HAD family hydrolase [Candidatus Atribacteria bacterium]